MNCNSYLRHFKDKWSSQTNNPSEIMPSVVILYIRKYRAIWCQFSSLLRRTFSFEHNHDSGFIVGRLCFWTVRSPSIMAVKWLGADHICRLHYFGCSAVDALFRAQWVAWPRSYQPVEALGQYSSSPPTNAGQSKM